MATKMNWNAYMRQYRARRKAQARREKACAYMQKYRSVKKAMRRNRSIKETENCIGMAAFDENLLRVGRQIPRCPYGKWAFFTGTRKHNGIINYGYTI